MKLQNSLNAKNTMQQEQTILNHLTLINQRKVSARQPLDLT